MVCAPRSARTAWRTSSKELTFLSLTSQINKVIGVWRAEFQAAHTSICVSALEGSAPTGRRDGETARQRFRRRFPAASPTAFLAQHFHSHFQLLLASCQHVDARGSCSRSSLLPSSKTPKKTPLRPSSSWNRRARSSQTTSSTFSPIDQTSSQSLPRSYAARLSFYKLKQFQCEVTGKSGLDYFQALESEQQEARTLHARFPQALKAPVLRAVQWRESLPPSGSNPMFPALITFLPILEVIGRLDHLVEAVYERFKDRYFESERTFGTRYMLHYY